jgi:hypothetical protein
MKKFLAVFVVLGLVAGGVAWAVTRTPERRLCMRMGDLCGAEGDFEDYEQCVESFEKLEKVVGEEPIETAAECVDEVDNCAKAAGCLAGAGYKAMPKLLHDFAEGFENAQ